MAKDEHGREYIDCDDGVRRYTGLNLDDGQPGIVDENGKKWHTGLVQENRNPKDRSVGRSLGIVAGLAALLIGCGKDIPNTKHNDRLVIGYGVVEIDKDCAKITNVGSLVFPEEERSSHWVNCKDDYGNFVIYSMTKIGTKGISEKYVFK